METKEFTAAQKRHRLMASGEVKVEHGSYSTYRNYLCRCADCTRANREYHRALRARKRQEAN